MDFKSFPGFIYYSSCRCFFWIRQNHPKKKAKNGQIFPTQKFEKTGFVIPKGHFVTKKGGFVMVAPEKEILS